MKSLFKVSMGGWMPLIVAVLLVGVAVLLPGCVTRTDFSAEGILENSEFIPYTWGRYEKLILVIDGGVYTFRHGNLAGLYALAEVLEGKMVHIDYYRDDEGHYNLETIELVGGE